MKPDLLGADLNGADLSEANLSRANLSSANLSGAKLSIASFNGADLSSADLSRANLIGADFTYADLSGANLSRAKLGSATLSRADLRSADLTNANLSSAYLSGAILTNAKLNGAKLRRANLSFANLWDAKLNGANLSTATIGWTVLGRVDLSAVKGLDTVWHQGPSSIGIDTIYMSNGAIPDAFLRGAGVPDNFISYRASLVGKAIEFYSCFISHSTQDKSFADRLFADLQTKGVRCWFAPEHLKSGDKFRERIDSSIRIHDKLLVILSKNSIESSWVEDEVEIAIERERRDRKPVLFPIRLDHAVMNTPVAWAAALRRKRHIGDFTQWKKNGPYQKAFARLLRDLRASDAVEM